MQFELGPQAKIVVKTYSSHYKIFAEQKAEYADWYKKKEHPDLSDEAFIQTDDFVLHLSDFHQRFSHARTLDW